jgi:16S rRNA (cytosine967-C5)-methyltransferase
MDNPTTRTRALALDALLRIEAGYGTLADVLARKRYATLDPRDRAFLHELLLGTLRHRGAIDHAVSSALDRPFEKLSSPALTAILRLGAYQILRMRVPCHAAVSQSVSLARHREPRASSLVNAVLRRLARDGPPANPDPQTDPIAWLTTEGSLPKWLAERWMHRLGVNRALDRARAFLELPPVTYRLNPRVAQHAHTQVLAAVSAPPRPLVVPGAWMAQNGRLVELSRRNMIYLQDQGSQLAAHLATRPGLILDACAAPGGKASLMADLVGDKGRVIASEASSRRLITMASLVSAWGSANVLCVGADALHPPFSARFDSVLIDAPCTGLGTLGRHPDIRWRTRSEDISRHAARQTALMVRLAPLVKPGGLLVYSTCSSEPEENEQIVDAFLSDHHVFRSAVPPDWARYFSDGPFFRTIPERDSGDSFFVAVLARLS